LTRILNSPTPVHESDAQLTLGGHAEIQAAFAVTVGYHARFLWPSTIKQARYRDGVYLAINYSFLRGVLFENVDSALRFDTDASGLLTLDPRLPPPMSGTRDHTSSGVGRAIDVGIGAVTGHWEFGGGVNGVANEITWSDVQRTLYTKDNLLVVEPPLVEAGTVSIPDVRVVLPVDVRGNAAYHEDRWSILMAVGEGYQGTTFHVGYERRPAFGAIRGGVFYTSGQWQPTGGFGWNLSERVALDVAVFGSSANIERERHLAIGASLHITERMLRPIRSR
jgi:hypothetical protein